MNEELLIPVSLFLSWATSHIIKEIIYVIKNRKFSWYTLLMETGGMPSSHSSVVSTLTTMVLLTNGFKTIFWVTLVFSLVVIRDAFGVRKNVSDQAHLLNKLTSHVKLQKKVEIVLGHTPFQVIVGVIIGICVSLITYYLPLSF